MSVMLVLVSAIVMVLSGIGVSSAFVVLLSLCPPMVLVFLVQPVKCTFIAACVQVINKVGVGVHLKYIDFHVLCHQPPGVSDYGGGLGGWQ